MKKEFKGQFIYLYVILLLFSNIFFRNSANGAVKKIIARDNYISVLFDIPVDTTINIYSAIKIFPILSGQWQWNSLYELLFIPDSSIPDTTVYILRIPPILKDSAGNSIGNLDLLFTVSKPISYRVQQVPLEWEKVNQWDVETDWSSGPKVYNLKPKIHPSYQNITRVVFCWEHIYYGSLKNNNTRYCYPHFVSSNRQNYKASVDFNGFLYLIDIGYRLRYRWYIFPENQLYRDLDVSNNGEILVALSPNEADLTTTVYLVQPDGQFIWTKKFLMGNDKIFELCFVDNLDEFLIYNNCKIYCFKILRE